MDSAHIEEVAPWQDTVTAPRSRLSLVRSVDWLASRLNIEVPRSFLNRRCLSDGVSRAGRESLTCGFSKESGEPDSHEVEPIDELVAPSRAPYIGQDSSGRLPCSR